MSVQDEALHKIIEFAPDNAGHLRLLREQVASRPGVIPFVGAGLSVPFGYKGWTAFLFEQAALAGLTETIKALIDKGEYEEAGERVRQGRGAVTFETALEAEYSVSKLNGKVLDKGAAARLPLMFDGPVVTSNFDRVLETVFAAAGHPFEREAWGANVTQTDKAFREGRHLLLKIHGDVQETSGRVFTKAEYTKHYETNLQGSLPALLYFMFTAHRLLFLGCSLGPDRTLGILDTAHQAGIGVLHFALVEAPGNESTRLTRHKYLGDRGILPIWYPNGEHELIEPFLLTLLESIPLERRPRPLASAAPARLSGMHDSRLNHRSGWYGRTQEVKALLAFLQDRKSAVQEISSVEGAPGIGKTELCKEALRRYLKPQTIRPVYYVDLSSARSGAELLDRLATSFGLSKTESREQIIRAIAATPGIVYLDNLEDVLEDQGAIHSLKLLAAIPQMKVLVSSRRRVPDGELHVRHIPISKLGDADAVRLFVEQWKRSGNKDSVQESNELVRAFVTEELSCHALSIVLVAAQGWRVGSFNLLREAWQEQSLGLAQQADEGSKASHRLTSLNTSLKLSLAAVQALKPITIGLWGLMVFFPAGLSRSAWRFILVEDPAWEESREGLLLFRLIEVDQEGTLSMLAPIRQFILSSAGGAKSAFVKEVARRAFNYFNHLVFEAREREHEHYADRTSAVTGLLAEFPNLHHFLSITTTFEEEWPEFLSELSAGLANYYQFRAVLSNEMLEGLLQQQQRAGLSEAEAFTSYLLGNIKELLGRRNEARKLYERSRDKYRAIGLDVGVATALQGLGDLEKDFDNLNNAHSFYEEARTIYEKANDHTGLANILQRLGDLHLLVKAYDEAQLLFIRTLTISQSIESKLLAANALRSQADAVRYKALIERSQGDEVRCQHLMEDARSMYEQALDLFLGEGDNLGFANTHYSLGELYFDQQDWATADKHYLVARDRYATVGTPRGLAKTYARLAQVAHARGDTLGGDNYLRDATAAAAASEIPALVKLVESTALEMVVGKNSVGRLE
ncbi:MAG TPA: tetratricopeptide repeat protein [Pyrinomonadaceae bacterium]|nr:tetratricopeptide repeat protein [Pyrinomonadaceae bacterium]